MLREKVKEMNQNLSSFLMEGLPFAGEGFLMEGFPFAGEGFLFEGFPFAGEGFLMEGFPFAGEGWLGLEKLHQLTKKRLHRLKVFSLKKLPFALNES